MEAKNIEPVDIGTKNVYKAAVEELKRNAPALIEYVTLMADIRRQAFLAYTAQGFTEYQALELCKDIIKRG